MPVLDGYQTTQAIRSSTHPQAQTIPIISLSADAFTEDIRRAYASGMNDHVSNPSFLKSYLLRSPASLKHLTKKKTLRA